MIYTFIQKIFPTNIAYRNIIFIPLFFTFYLVLKIFEPSLYLLENFSGRPISIATYEGIDIGKRVSLFYKAILFSSILFLLFTRLIVLIRFYFQEEELSILNGISLAGFCLLFFKLIGADMSATFHFIFALIIIIGAGFVSHQVKKRYDRPFTTIFLWTILISVSLFFLQWQIFNFTIGKNIFSLPAIVVITGIPLYLLFTGNLHLSNKLFKASRALIFLPLLSFISIELYMILNQRGIYLSPKIIYLAGLVFILIRCIIVLRRKEQLHLKEPLNTLMFKNWIPWMIAGIACIAFYQPIVQPEIDWFEDANHVLPLHQWFSFGKIPFLDSFSSHTFSDFAFGLIYSFLNGANPMGGFVYGFLLGIIFMIVVYFFIFKITGDGFLAIWMTLAYPFTGLLIPSYFNLVPLVALAFILLYEKQTVKRYFFFFSSVMFMLIWRIDLGSSTLFAATGGFIFLLFFTPSFKTERKNLFKGLGLTLFIAAILFLVAFIHSGSHLFVSLKDALGYMSSFQSYGIRDLSPGHDMNYFSLYFIFPAVILLTMIHSIYNIIRNNTTDNRTTIFRLVIIFLGLFYFSNLQRGLVRHTLSEQWDTALTSFGYFIISSIVIIKFPNRNSFIRFFVFFVVSTLLISNYVYTSPDLKTNNYYSYLNAGITKPFTIPYSKEKINRINEDPAYKSDYAEFSDWMKKNIPDKSTFLDFSNTPMLYYYSNRIVPNYFDQIPHTAHNEYLQKRFIDDLKNYDLPVVVFSNTPPVFWDFLDGIPNALRHYHIAEYIYKNYSPAFIMSHHCIWIKKNLNVNSPEKELLSVSIHDMDREKVSVQEESVSADDENSNLSYNFKTPLLYEGNKIYMTLNVSSNIDGWIVVHYKSGTGNFNDKQKVTAKIYKGNNNLFVMATPLENEKDISAIKINLPDKSLLSFSPLKIFSSGHFKDYSSSLPVEYSVRWIPYIWGAYDENYKAGKILTEENILSTTKLIKANNESAFDFKPVSEKENGNYLKLTARIPSGKETNAMIGYGTEGEMNGSFSFALKGDSLSHDYLIRVSSQYNWYNKKNSRIYIHPAENDIEITKAEILKGD